MAQVNNDVVRCVVARSHHRFAHRQSHIGPHCMLKRKMPSHTVAHQRWLEHSHSLCCTFVRSHRVAQVRRHDQKLKKDEDSENWYERDSLVVG